MNEHEFKQLYEGNFDPFPEKRIFIVGGTHTQSAFLARVNQIPRDMWQHVSGAESLHGYRNIQVCFYGNWYERADAAEIADYVDALVGEKLAEIVDLPDRPQT